MRVHRWALLGFMMVQLTACAATETTEDGIASAGGTPTAAATASPSATPLADADRAIKFAQCMRENGIEMEDPVDGRIQMRFKGEDPAKVEAASEQCKQWLPNGGQPMKLNPEQAEAMRKMAQCMRENGVPNFPDPGGGEVMKLDIGKLGVDRETLEAALAVCEKYRPVPPSPSVGA